MSFNEGNLHEEVERLRRRVEELEAQLLGGARKRTIPAPEDRTCETCDWYCYGTWDDNTCDKWEKTIYEVPVPDDVIARIMHLPTKTDMQKVIEEAEGLYD